MPDKVTKEVRNGEECWLCAICGAVLVRMEPGGILGNGVIDLDKLVVEDHYMAKHG